MTTLQFPSNPKIGDEYDYPPYKYYWDGQKWKTKGIGYNPVNDLRNELKPKIDANTLAIEQHKTESDAHAIGKITGLRDELDGISNSVGMRRFTSSQAASKSYYDGELVYITDAGYVFKFKSSRYLIAGQAQSEITFNDNLHILVTAGGMLQFAEFDKLRGVQSANAARFAAAIKDRTTPVSVDCYGDSTTFGQALPDTLGAVNRIDSPTGFGDGSTHQHWQFNNNYPAWINSYFAENLWQSNVVNNFGYSGDRTLSGYLRHRTISGSMAATIMYGINDCLYGTSNGSQPERLTTDPLYSVEQHQHILRLFAAKQILQGKYVTILSNTTFASLAGFDGSQLAAMKLTRAYSAAAKRVAEEFGCKFVDLAQDIFAQYGLMEITQEGTHLGPDGLKIAGQRIAAALATVETDNRVSHGSVLLANPSINAVLSHDAVNVLPNATSTTPRGTLSNDRTCLVVGDNWISVPFYAEAGGLVAFINGQASAAGSTFDVRLDDGALQSDFHFQNDLFSGKPTASKQLTKAIKFTRDNANISDDTNEVFLHIANRGWHTISVRKVSGSSSLLLDSIMFESLPSVIAADVFGVTASCSVSAGVLDSRARNIASVSQDYSGEFSLAFTHELANNRYTIVVDVNETNADPITITTRYKTTDTCGVAFNKWNGTAWVKFTPSMFTIKIIGGR